MGTACSVEEHRLIALDFGDAIKLPHPDQINKRIVSHSLPPNYNIQETLSPQQPKSPRFPSRVILDEYSTEIPFDDVYYEMRFESLRKDYHNSDVLSTAASSSASNTDNLNSSSDSPGLSSSFIKSSFTGSFTGSPSDQPQFDPALLDDKDDRFILFDSINSNFTEFKNNKMAQLAYSGVERAEDNKMHINEFMNSYPSFQSYEKRAEYILKILLRKTKKIERGFDQKQKPVPSLKLVDLADILALGKEKPRKLQNPLEKRHYIKLAAFLLYQTFKGKELSKQEEKFCERTEELLTLLSDNNKPKVESNNIIDSLGEIDVGLKHFTAILTWFEGKIKGTEDDNMLRL